MSDEHKHEIVIIRRGGHGAHDEHHGGVWKIAFADFMTAMMAFFLVMWLISANDKTRASVARYFNPVRLVDATTQPRGLHDSKKDESGITASPDSKPADDKQSKPETTSKESKESVEGKVRKEGKDGSEGKDDKKGAKAEKETPAARDRRLDTALRENPYLALAEIVATKGPGGEQLVTTPPAPAIGRRGGESFRDPFEPPPPPPSEGADKATDTTEPPTETKAAAEAPAPADAEVKSPPAPSAAAAVAQPGAVTQAKRDVEAKKDTEVKKDTEAKKDAQRKDEVKALLAALKPQAGHDGPHVDVKQTAEGLLVSFTDTSTFAMFANGSAVPARPLVLMMENVAKLLKSRPGTIIVRGFTDNKPYRAGRYDNWHLSIDRAQVTHYMLVRGGFDDTRIGHVEGYADRSAKPGIDPASPLNRRIEILLKEPT